MIAANPGKDATSPIGVLTRAPACRHFITVRSRDLRLAGLRGDIAHLDEILTLSPRTTSRQAVGRWMKLLRAATLLTIGLLISTWLMVIGRLKSWLPGGRLTVPSDGGGTGATFTLELPVFSPRSRPVHS